MRRRAGLDGGATRRTLALAFASAVVLLVCGLQRPAQARPAQAPTAAPDAAAEREAAELEDELARVIIYSPAAGKAAMGAVTFRADVFSQFDVREVRLRVDGREVGTFVRPPYELTVDVGEQNRAHRFEVVVLGHGLELARVVRETPPILVDDEVNLNLRQLYVTVTHSGQRVLDLERSDFEIFDEGRVQSVVTFETGDAALAAAILLDASTSMRGERLRAAVQGARAFVRGLKELDEASLILFSDRLLYRSKFSASTKEFDAHLASVSASGGTALNDHLFYATKLLESRQGRRVVILLSDGIDVDSTLSMRDVRWMIQRSQSVFYWIRLQEGGAEAPTVITPWRSPEEHAQERDLLEQAVTDSGGRIVSIASVEEAEAAFGAILAELREQYVLGYYPDVEHDDGRWRAVEVRVDRNGANVRTRDGYLDY